MSGYLCEDFIEAFFQWKKFKNNINVHYYIIVYVKDIICIQQKLL